MGKLEAGLTEARHLMWSVWKAYLIFPVQKLGKLAVTDHSGSAFFGHTWSGHGLFMYSFSHPSYRICSPIYNIIFQDPFLFLPRYRFQRNPSSAWQPNSLERWYPRWERTCSPLVISWGGLGGAKNSSAESCPVQIKRQPSLSLWTQLCAAHPQCGERPQALMWPGVSRS